MEFSSAEFVGVASVTAMCSMPIVETARASAFAAFPVSCSLTQVVLQTSERPLDTWGVRPLRP